jgi:hypothetical protein
MPTLDFQTVKEGIHHRDRHRDREADRETKRQRLIVTKKLTRRD